MYVDSKKEHTHTMDKSKDSDHPHNIPSAPHSPGTPSPDPSNIHQSPQIVYSTHKRPSNNLIPIQPTHLPNVPSVSVDATINPNPHEHHDHHDQDAEHSHSHSNGPAPIHLSPSIASPDGAREATSTPTSNFEYQNKESIGSTASVTSGGVSVSVSDTGGRASHSKGKRRTFGHINQMQKRLIDTMVRYCVLASIAFISTVLIAVLSIVRAFLPASDILSLVQAELIIIDCGVNIICLILQFKFEKDRYYKHCKCCDSVLHRLFGTAIETQIEAKMSQMASTEMTTA